MSRTTRKVSVASRKITESPGGTRQISIGMVVENEDPGLKDRVAQWKAQLADEVSDGEDDFDREFAKAEAHHMSPGKTPDLGDDLGEREDARKNEQFQGEFDWGELHRGGLDEISRTNQTLIAQIDEKQEEVSR